MLRTGHYSSKAGVWYLNGRLSSSGCLDHLSIGFAQCRLPCYGYKVHLIWKFKAEGLTFLLMQLPIVLGEIVLNDEDKLIMRALNLLD